MTIFDSSPSDEDNNHVPCPDCGGDTAFVVWSDMCARCFGSGYVHRSDLSPEEAAQIAVLESQVPDILDISLPSSDDEEVQNNDSDDDQQRDLVYLD